MIRSNTRRQAYLGITIASYIYFIGDAAVSYKTNDVSECQEGHHAGLHLPRCGTDL